MYVRIIGVLETFGKLFLTRFIGRDCGSGGGRVGLVMYCSGLPLRTRQLWQTHVKLTFTRKIQFDIISAAVGFNFFLLIFTVILLLYTVTAVRVGIQG